MQRIAPECPRNHWPEHLHFALHFRRSDLLFARISAIIGAIFHFPLRNALRFSYHTSQWEENAK